MNDDLSTAYLDKSRRHFSVKAVTAGILFSFFCILSCLIFLRIQWLLPGAYYASGIQYQMLGGIPVLVWTVFLLSNRIPVLNRNQFWKLFILAVILRIILLDVPPVQSNDIYRYIWEGRLHWEGINPYRYSPDNPVLFHLNDNLHERINHGHLPAIYPPLTQWWNALAVYPGYCLTGRPIPWMKMAYVFWDLMTLLLLPTWLKRNRVNSSWSVVWAFHPLVIIEFSGNGHLDSLMIFLMLAAMCLSEKPNNEKRPLKYKIFNAPAVAILLAGAVSAKIIPILAFPFFVRQLKRRAVWLPLVPILFLFSYLPYWDAGFSGLILSPWEYMTAWAGPAPAFSLITICSGGNDQVARFAYQSLVVILALILFCVKCRLTQAVWWVFMAYTVLSPIIHPWYTLLLLPFTLGHPLYLIPWMWLTLTIPLTYINYLEFPPDWVNWLVWLPFWILLPGGYLFRSRGAQQRHDR